MGCGKLDRVDSLDHAMGLLEEKKDARVREHLASCDACRSDSGDFMVLAESLRALREVTRLAGRENFADRTRSEVRNSFGSTRVHRQTAAWRVANTGESQRLLRAEMRRRGNILRVVKVVGVVAGAVACAVALFCWFLGPAVVDRYCEPVERVLGVDFAAWGLRPDLGDVASRAAGTAPGDDVRSLARPIARLLARGFVSRSRSAESVVLLEFAQALALDGMQPGVLAAALREAGDREGREALAAADALLARKARSLWRKGEIDRAQKALLLSALEGSALGDYYLGAMAAEAGDVQGAAAKLQSAADALPVVWMELAWRSLRAGDEKAARVAIAKAPDGELKEALRGLLPSANPK